MGILAAIAFIVILFGGMYYASRNVSTRSRRDLPDRNAGIDAGAAGYLPTGGDTYAGMSHGGSDCSPGDSGGGGDCGGGGDA